MTFIAACKLMGVNPKYGTWQQVRDLYKELAKDCHPDKRGGDRHDWDVLQEAYQGLRCAFSVPQTCTTCKGEQVVLGPKFVITKCPTCNGVGTLPPQCKGLTP